MEFLVDLFKVTGIMLVILGLITFTLYTLDRESRDPSSRNRVEECKTSCLKNGGETYSFDSYTDNCRCSGKVK